MNKKNNSRIKTLKNNRRIKRSKRSKISKRSKRSKISKRSKRSKISKGYKRSKRSKRSKNKRKNKRSYKMKGGASAAMDAGLSRSRQRRTTRPETWAWRWGDGRLLRIWSMYYSKDEIVEVLKTREEDIPVELYSTAKNKTHKADNPAKAIQWLTKPIIYRIGIELEGCHDFVVDDKDLNAIGGNMCISAAPTDNYPAIVIPHYEVRDKYSISNEMDEQLTHFDLEGEKFPCKLSKDLKRTFPEDFERHSIISRKGLRFLIENSPQFRDGEENKCSLELILKNEAYYTCLSQFDSMYLTKTTLEDVTTDVTAEVNRDIERIMQKLDPPLHGGLDDDLTKAGLELHLHVSDENDKGKGLNFLDPKTLKFCMTICLLWYGCPGHCDSFYDEFVKLGYNFDSRPYPKNAYQNPEGNQFQSRIPPHFQMVEEYRATPEIEWEEFKRIFEGLDKGGEAEVEKCIFYLLTTMYPNRTKYMPIHIYNLKFIPEIVANFWISGQQSGVEIEGENIVEMLEFILTSSETSDIRSAYALELGPGVKKFAEGAPEGGRRPFNLLNVYDEFLYSPLAWGLTEQPDRPVPLRIEFRNSKLRKTSPVKFLTNYTKMITIFFDYAKKMSEDFSSLEEIKVKTPMEVFEQCGHISVFSPMVVGPETFNRFDGPQDFDLSEYGLPGGFAEYIRKIRKKTSDSHLPMSARSSHATGATGDMNQSIEMQAVTSTSGAELSDTSSDED